MNEVLVANCVLDSPSAEDGQSYTVVPGKSIEDVEKKNISSDEELEVFGFKKQTGRIMNSDSESDHSKRAIIITEHIYQSTEAPRNIYSIAGDESSSEDDLSIYRRKPLNTKIRDNTSGSSDSEGEHILPKTSPKRHKDSRILSKQNKMKAKFNNLLMSRDKANNGSSLKKLVKSSSSETSDDDEIKSEAFSIENIKKKIEERNKTLKSTIYDPDTSDDEKAYAQEENEKNRSQHKRKTSPKPAARMSAKQAMENMKKIKSEANRMLREREVSLPYHRPKALTLKDILARKKPATSVDGTAFSIKMNEKQLQEYAEMLEERQKHMMELCKSDSDDEAGICFDDALGKGQNNKVINEDTNEKDQYKDLTNGENNVDQSIPCEEEEKMNISVANDELFDSQVSEVNNLVTDTETAKISLIKETDDPKNHDSDDLQNHAPSNNNTEIDSQLISLHYSESEKCDTNTEITECDNNTLGINDASPNSTETNLVTEIANKNSLKNTEENKILHGECEKDILSDKENTILTDKEGEILNDSEYILNDEEKQNYSEKLIHNVNENSEAATKHNDQDDAFNDFLDDDKMNMDEIDQMIEDAEILENTNKDCTDSPMLIREPYNLRVKPKLTGAPGMLIDLDGTDASGPRKISGIELLKQRFVYFTNLKTPEELQKEARNRINPGLQHQKLKQELEDQIAEQRSLEWSKRLEEEKQQQAELSAIRGDDSDADDELDIDKLDAKIENEERADESSETETEPEENDIEIKDKPLKKNALLDNEAEESEGEDVEAQDPQNDANDQAIDNGNNYDENETDDESGDELSDDETSSDDEINAAKPKKGRIIKAFEDSDEEGDTQDKLQSNSVLMEKEEHKTSTDVNANTDTENISITTENIEKSNKDNINRSLNDDDDLQSAQLQKSISEDFFTSQEADQVTNIVTNLDSNKKSNIEEITTKPDEKLTVICETQPFDEGNFDDIVGMCSGSFSQNILTTQAMESTQHKDIPLTNKELNGDILALCTGKFFDNQFVSQHQESAEETTNDLVANELDSENHSVEQSETNNSTKGKRDFEAAKSVADKLISANETSKDDNLQSILEELHDPEFDKPTQSKFFKGSASISNTNNSLGNQSKKRFVLDSDEEDEANKPESRTKKRKKKLEQRALQISDEEDSEDEIEDEYESALEDMVDEKTERLVEYDSEENEVEILPKNHTKKKSKARDFFEQEAELTSEDEWVGSGDEDEAGLDRMEREEGDDEHFQQDTLHKQLANIHMRDMLDQDKREVRMIQELLLEDGDLGGGHRQRKFRWKNADGVEEGLGPFMDDVGSTQELEDEIESEEQWQRQSHERAMYLRQMMSQQKEDDLEDVVEVSYNQSALVTASTKANVSSENLAVTNENAPVFGKKTSKDIPSPAKKPFALLQHYSRGSILSRGTGALARLAALASPLAGEGTEEGPKATSLGPSSKRNFVFTTVSPSAADKPKIAKRKAENIGTPNLMKKLKAEAKPARSAKTSLLDHLKG